MEPQIGDEATDKSGKLLGDINYVIRDTWSGEIRKLMIYRKPPDKDIILIPADISEVNEGAIKLNVTLEELNGRALD